MILRIFDQLPPSMQSEHDEYRSRLGLYASMVGVFLLAAGIAAIPPLLALTATARTVAIVLMLCLALLSYRASIASARGYGTVLRTVAERRRASN